jgi:hypothetical protein
MAKRCSEGLPSTLGITKRGPGILPRNPPGRSAQAGPQCYFERALSRVPADDPWLSIQWDPGHRCVYAEWKGFANSREFRAGLMRIADTIQAHDSALLVSDNRRLEGVAEQDQLWIRDTWTPLAVAAGLKRIAVVVAHHGLGKIATEEILSQVGMKVFATRTFTTVSEATEWVSES